MDETAIHELLSSLARHHPSGGRVIERAAVLAAGSDFPQVLAWISDHGGHAEMAAPAAIGGGLHGSRVKSVGSGGQGTPLRYVFEDGVLN